MACTARRGRPRRVNMALEYIAPEWTHNSSGEFRMKK